MPTRAASRSSSASSGSRKKSPKTLAVALRPSSAVISEATSLQPLTLYSPCITELSLWGSMPSIFAHTRADGRGARPPDGRSHHDERAGLRPEPPIRRWACRPGGGRACSVRDRQRAQGLVDLPHEVRGGLLLAGSDGVGLLALARSEEHTSELQSRGH